MARVRHGEAHVGARRGADVLARDVGVELDVRGLDRELAAEGHGLVGVGREVHDHVLDLAGVGAHVPEARGAAQRELDVVAEDAPQRGLHRGEGLVEVEGARPHHLPAAEGDELPREV